MTLKKLNTDKRICHIKFGETSRICDRVEAGTRKSQASFQSFSLAYIY